MNVLYSCLDNGLGICFQVKVCWSFVARYKFRVGLDTKSDLFSIKVSAKLVMVRGSVTILSGRNLGARCECYAILYISCRVWDLQWSGDSAVAQASVLDKQFQVTISYKDGNVEDSVVHPKSKGLYICVFLYGVLNCTAWCQVAGV